MMFTASHSALLEAAHAATLATDAKGALPVLANLRLTATNTGSIQILGTNLEIALKAQLDADVRRPGDYLIPAKLFVEVLRELPDLPVEIKFLSSYHLSIRSESGFRGRIACVEASDFPEIIPMEADATITIPRGDLQRVLHEVGFAVSDDLTRLSLNGIYLQPHYKHVLAVATDGHRLGYIVLPEAMLEGKESLETGWIVPTKTLSLALKYAASEEDTISIRFWSTAVEFVVGSWSIIAKLFEGPYPNYRQILTPKTTWKASLHREDLLACIRRAATVCGSSKRVLLSPDSANRLSISTRGDGAESEEGMSTQAPHTLTAPICVNCKYLLELLRLIPATIIHLEGSDPNNAIQISADNLPLEKARWILMPIRIET